MTKYIALILVALASMYFISHDGDTTDQVLEPVTNVIEVPISIQMADIFEIDHNLSMAIYTHATNEGIPLDIAYALIMVESRFNPNAVSSKDAIGLTQVMLPTARMVVSNVTRRDLFHIDTSLLIGFRYLRSLYDHYGDWHSALSAYNHGPARFDTYYVTTTNYSRTVLGG
jgi:soluble lytic murein transglycosylase-like protein